MFQALSALAPPEAEPVSVELVRAHVRVDHLLDDALLAVYVSAARSLAENYLGRALPRQQLRYAVSDSPPAASNWPLAATPVILPQWLPFPLTFQRPLRLPRFPVASIDRVAVSRSGQDDDQEMQAGRDFSADLSNSPARLTFHADKQPSLGQHAVVDFTAGYLPAQMPPVFTAAVLFGAAWLYEHRGDGDEQDLPPAFYALLSPYRLVTFG